MQKPGRTPHWRCNHKQAEAASRAFHRTKVFAPIKALGVLLDVLLTIRPRSVEEASARLRCRHAYDEALPYLTDEEGTVRL
jgi:hypothetical protein